MFFSGASVSILFVSLEHTIVYFWALNSRSEILVFLSGPCNIIVMAVIPNRIAAYKIIRSMSERIGISHKVFPHALRGTFATILAAKNFNVWEIMDALGWTSAKTAEIYIRFSAARVSKAFKEKW